MTKPLRLIFAGTPDFAAHHLQTLIDSEHEVIACYTQPDRPAGRGKKLRPSPVKELALNAGIPVFQPATLKDPTDQQLLAGHGADVMVVVAYGLLLPQAVLDAPRQGCVNVHASLLPRWRGAAPIQRAIEAGDSESGVTIMQMEAGLDTGPMLTKARCPIDASDTAASLHDRLMELGGPALLEALSRLADGTAEPQKQDDCLANYAAKITKAEAEVNWQDDACDIDRRIRAFNPFPVAYTSPERAPEQRIRLWQAQPLDADGPTGTIVQLESDAIVVGCGRGCLRITRLQLPGKRAMDAGELLRGRGDLFAVGERFAEPAR